MANTHNLTYTLCTLNLSLECSLSTWYSSDITEYVYKLSVLLSGGSFHKLFLDSQECLCLVSTPKPTRVIAKKRLCYIGEILDMLCP